MRRGSPLAPGRRKVRPRVPDRVREQVRARTHGKCHLCLWRLGATITPDTAETGPTAFRALDYVRGARRIAHLHHVFSEQKFPELVAEPLNLIGLCVECHGGHHHPGVNDTRMPRAALMAETLALALDDGPRLNYLDRAYAATDAGAARRHDTTEEAQHG